MKTGIVAPSRQELEPFLKRCENVEATKRSGFEFFTATLFDKELVCVICGICKTNAACATQALLDGFDVSRDRKSTRLNSSHKVQSRMPSSA